MKILFLVPYPTEGPSNRFRVEQYLPYLSQMGCQYSVSPFWTKNAYRILYGKGAYFKKLFYFFIGTLRRIKDIFSVTGYDIIFIHREAYPIGPPLFEWLVHSLKKPVIFDFDDAIFLQNYNPANRFYRFLKFPSKIKRIIQMSFAVIVANNFLKEYADKYNSSVFVIPTAIDTDKFNIRSKYSGRLTIGWVGSQTAGPYLELIFNVMQKLSRRYDFIFKIIGAGYEVSIPGVAVENIKWSLEDEIVLFQSIDIGIYPLPDNSWTRGKAAFKAIQYMSVGIPVIASPVGMARELIQDGVNGFLSDLEQEWFKNISRLIDNVELRSIIGLAGRKTVEEKYSIKVNFPKFFEVIKNCHERCIK